MSYRRILIVAHRTAASPKLLAAVTERAAREPCTFTLLVPRPYWDPDTEEGAAIALELAIPMLDAPAIELRRGNDWSIVDARSRTSPTAPTG